MARMTRTAAMVGLLVLGFFAGSLIVRQATGASEPATDPTDPPDQGHAWAFDNPLGGGAVVAERDEAEAFLSSRSGEWPGLPTEAQVTGSWIRDEDGYVAFELANGMTVLIVPDTRSQAEFARDAERMIEGEGATWPFKMESIRGVQASATDIHELVTRDDGVQDGPGPAAISWVEGGFLISLIGGPPATASGVPLSELRAFAESMG